MNLNKKSLANLTLTRAKAKWSLHSSHFLLTSFDLSTTAPGGRPVQGGENGYCKSVKFKTKIHLIIHSSLLPILRMTVVRLAILQLQPEYLHKKQIKCYFKYFFRQMLSIINHVINHWKSDFTIAMYCAARSSDGYLEWTTGTKQTIIFVKQQ